MTLKNHKNHSKVMKKPEIIILNKQNWHSITSDTLWNVYSLLNATRTLADTCIEREEGDPTVAAGLYTFAVEEYGKYLYLKSLEPIDKKYHVNYVDYFQKHPKKFERALSNLPHECKLVHLGEYEDTEFYESDFHDDIIANFETRLRVLYTDLDPNFANKVSKMQLPVDSKLLKIAVEKFWEIADSEFTKLMKEKHNK